MVKVLAAEDTLYSGCWSHRSVFFEEAPAQRRVDKVSHPHENDFRRPNGFQHNSSFMENITFSGLLSVLFERVLVIRVMVVKVQVQVTSGGGWG